MSNLLSDGMAPDKVWRLFWFSRTHKSGIIADTAYSRSSWHWAGELIDSWIRCRIIREAFKLLLQPMIHVNHVAYTPVIRAIMDRHSFIRLKDKTVYRPSLAVAAAPAIALLIIDLYEKWHGTIFSRAIIQSGCPPDCRSDAEWRGIWTDEDALETEERIRELTDAVLEAHSQIRRVERVYDRNLESMFQDRVIDEETKRQIARLIQDREFTRMLSTMGKMLSQFHAQGGASPGQDEIVGVTLSGDLKAMTGESILHVSDEDLSPLFYKDFVQSSLTTYQYQSSEQRIRGPVFCLLDFSGSMNLAGKYRQAKALTLAVHLICRNERRACLVSTFNHRGADFRNLNSPGTMTEFLSMRPYGGTYSARALIQTLKVLEIDDVCRDMDILMVTDGLDSLSKHDLQGLLNLKQRAGTRLFIVYAGGGTNSSLSALADYEARMRDGDSDLIVEKNLLQSIFGKNHDRR